MRTIVAIVLCLSGSGTSVACSSFREPNVNFQGITTDVELRAYTDEILTGINKEFEARLSCYERNVQNNRLPIEDEERESDEFTQYSNDVKRFSAQLKQAGAAHLALVAAQPFKGSYDGSATSSSGGAPQVRSSAPAGAPAARQSAVQPAARATASEAVAIGIYNYPNGGDAAMYGYSTFAKIALGRDREQAESTLDKLLAFEMQGRPGARVGPRVTCNSGWYAKAEAAKGGTYGRWAGAACGESSREAAIQAAIQELRKAIGSNSYDGGIDVQSGHTTAAPQSNGVASMTGESSKTEIR